MVKYFRITLFFICLIYTCLVNAQGHKISQFTFELGVGSHNNTLKPTIGQINSNLTNVEYKPLFEINDKSIYSYSHAEYHVGYFIRTEPKPFRKLTADWSIGLVFNTHSFGYSFQNSIYSYKEQLTVTSNASLLNLGIERTFFSPWFKKPLRIFGGTGISIGKTYLANFTFDEFQYNDSTFETRFSSIKSKDYASLNSTLIYGFQYKLYKHCSIDLLGKGGYYFNFGRKKLNNHGLFGRFVLRVNWSI
jgi:hypothetical protein